MHKLFLILCIFLCNMLMGVPMHHRALDPSGIARLCKLLDIPQEENPSQAIQSRWMRPGDKERWEIPELNDETRELVLDWAETYGLFAAWEPSQSFYDKAVILGATTGAMQLRLEFLHKLWQEGIRFTEIVWLTGDRPLDPKVDSFCDVCRTESDAASVVWKLATHLSQEFRSIPVSFIAAPMQQEASGIRRPHIGDLIRSFVEKHSNPSSLLFISQQPFCGYQYALIHKYLPQEFLFDCVGKGVQYRDKQKATSILDTVSRWLYVEEQSLK